MAQLISARVVTGTILSLVFTTSLTRAAEDRVMFNRDVRPILADKCFACHGPDKNRREADLRLDTQVGLIGTADETGVVVPGRPDDSPLWHRVTSTEEFERMPPPDFGKELSAQDRETLRRWIEQGATWQGHWAFLPIGRPSPPDVDGGPRLKNEIDRFILQKLGEHGLQPSPEADRVTLLRRLYFDLVGLPPMPDEVEAFLADESPQAYERTVDRLLASPHFGERMAIWWLDLVRYADSVGYHGDQPVSVSPFRDYVIRSFQENKPFDQFTLEQLAGDLLPEATLEDKVASGYNRLGMMSAEGGVQPKEYLAKYIAERVRNIGGAWLGITLNCCECHDHKFDPFTMRDFYSMQAFFADIQERGLYSGAHASGEWGPRIKLPTPEQQTELDRIDAEIATLRKQLDTSTPELAAAQQQWESDRGASATAPPPAQTDALPENVRTILAVPPGERSDQQRAELAAYYRSISPALQPVRDQLGGLEKQRAQLDAQVTSTLITVSVEPRTIRLLPRGNWMDDSGEELKPAMPAILPQPPASEGRLTRADLARWLTSPENPLTARTFVNRLWKLYFGAGLSRKLDDLGAQGEWPSHPELLDWLAGRFVDSGWDIQQLVKLMVMSGTYRQSSLVSPQIQEADPYNRWLARQGRFRLDAELVRDNALKISGLLVEKIGGPSVYPYQPPGYWAYLNFPTREWPGSSGDDLYRRSLYTHWQRQYLHPALVAFDAPSREECTAERARSNTPLQSLVLMNDPEYVEAARVLAAKCLKEAGSDTRQRLEWLFRRALSRTPNDEESGLLAALMEQHLAEYRQDSKAVDDLLGVGNFAVPATLDRAELAAWTSVTRTVLNLHETITRN